MFSSVGWAEIMILMIAGLVILGPERLPDALKWTLRSVRQVRDYATGATNQLKDDLGADFEDLRKPLAELNELRGMSPRKAITKHLLDGDDSFFTGNFDAETKIKPVSKPLPTTDENSQVIGTGATPKPSLSKAPSASGDTASTQSAPSSKSAVSTQKAVSTQRAVSTPEVATAPTGEISGVDRWDAT